MSRGTCCPDDSPRARAVGDRRRRTPGRPRPPGWGPVRGVPDGPPHGRYSFPVPWEIDAYRRSVGGLSPASVRAYSTDAARFAEWAGRAGAEGPAAVDRIMLRRYLAFLSTRRYSKA